MESVILINRTQTKTWARARLFMWTMGFPMKASFYLHGMVSESWWFQNILAKAPQSVWFKWSICLEVWHINFEKTQKFICKARWFEALCTMYMKTTKTGNCGVNEGMQGAQSCLLMSCHFPTQLNDFSPWFVMMRIKKIQSREEKSKVENSQQQQQHPPKKKNDFY